MGTCEISFWLIQGVSFLGMFFCKKSGVSTSSFVLVEKGEGEEREVSVSFQNEFCFMKMFNGNPCNGFI